MSKDFSITSSVQLIRDNQPAALSGSNIDQTTQPGYSGTPSAIKQPAKRYGKAYRKYTKSTKVNANDLNPFLEDVDTESNKSINPFKKKISASSKKYLTNDRDSQLEVKSTPSKREWTKKDQKEFVKKRKKYEANLELINVNPKDEQIKIRSIKQYYQKTMAGLPQEDILAKIEKSIQKFEKLPGVTPNYKSDTSDEFMKYQNTINVKFSKWSQRKKDMHTMRLWRTLFNKARGCNICITQFQAINTKLAFFGRQLISELQIDKEKEDDDIFAKTNSLSMFQINPQGSLKRGWDFLIIIILLYTAIIAPYNTAFIKDVDISQAQVSLELAIDTLFITDIFLTFLTPYQRMNGTFETRYKTIAINYLTGAFLIDFVSSFPTGLLANQDSDKDGANKLLRLARLQRLYKLLRIARVIKLLKFSKYSDRYEQIVNSFAITKQTSRVAFIGVLSLFAMHLFSCFYFLSAKMHGFTENTWVFQTENIDQSSFDAYLITMYWACQTLTTVGYGDFGCYNNWEISITIVWMFLGVAIYSIVVGSLTSAVVGENNNINDLQNHLKALNDFDEQAQISEVFENDDPNNPSLLQQITEFLQQNYSEQYLKIEIENLTSELPPNLKEEIFFHQYGFLVQEISFLRSVDNMDFTWSLASQLQKIRYMRNDVLYTNGFISQTLFFIQYGKIKLYAENEYSFETYTKGDNFGEGEVFSGVRRIGTARAFEVENLLYTISSFKMDLILGEYPLVKRQLLKQSIGTTQRLLSKQSQKLMERNAMFGVGQRVKEQLEIAFIEMIETRKQLQTKQAQYTNLDNFSHDELAQALDAIKTEGAGTQTVASQNELLSEQEIKDAMVQIRSKNHQFTHNADNTTAFTGQVHGLVNQLQSDSNVKDSLNFEYQQMRIENDDNGHYKRSTRMTKLKDKFQDTVVLSNVRVLTQQAKTKEQKKKALKEARDSAINQIPYFQEIKDLQDIIESNPAHRDDAAELSLELISNFNTDMKVLGVNAIHLRDLLVGAQDEYDMLHDWMQKLETQTIESQDQMSRVMKSIDKFAQKSRI